MSSAIRTADVLVVGGGIAGASLAARLADRARVIVLEMEDRPGHHATGRSAANWEPTFGPPVIRALTWASEAFFEQPPEGFTAAPLVSPRGSLVAGTAADDELLAASLASGYREIGRDEAVSRLPLLRAEAFARFLHDETLEDVDVDLLHGGFLRQVRKSGGEVICRAEVTAGRRQGGAWHLTTPAGAFAAPVVANAAGAWADVVARRLGIRPRGLVPKRRSAAILPAPAPDVMAWPQFSPARETFYCKPTGGKLMLSPADQDPSEPHDAFADDLRLAEAAAALEEALAIPVRRLERTWGGLRTFAPDGDPIVGYAREAEGFFWYAGQGGYGIQTSPGLSELGAALLLRAPLPHWLARHGIDPASLSPERPGLASTSD